MKYSILFIAALTILSLASCNSKEKQVNNITTIEKTLLDKAAVKQVDTAAVHSLINQYETFATNFPKDSLAPEYLFKEADFYRYMGKVQKAIDVYGKVYLLYPDYRKRAYCLFLQGFLYENELHDLAQAKERYETFLKNYPNVPMARDVQFSLNNLGKSPEQIIQEFQQKRNSTAVN